MSKDANSDCQADAAAPQLSVIIPVYNESPTLHQVVDRVGKLPVSHEIVIVDDGSLDGTAEIAEKLAERPLVRAILHECNRGKGAAVRTGLANSRGEIVVIQDADLEYDPLEIERLIQPILRDEADVVFGSRFAGTVISDYPMTRLAANRTLTRFSNLVTGLQLSDMETCFKAMRRKVVDNLQIRENRFGVEPELTAKIARGGWRIVEVPITYRPRGKAAGKKIGFFDGIAAIWCILRYSRWD